MTKSNSSNFLRLLPIIVGSLGGSLLLINRLFTPEITPSQARSDVLGVILSAVLLLLGLLWRQIQSVAPEQVTLTGETGFELDDNLPETVKIELAWASHLLLTNTVTRSVVVYYQNRILLRRGVLGDNREINPGMILKRVLEQHKPVYLVDLKHYPGRIEFDYLPENIQGLICQPIGEEGVLILATNIARSYTKQDEAWIAGIADKLAQTLVLNSIK